MVHKSLPVEWEEKENLTRPCMNNSNVCVCTVNALAHWVLNKHFITRLWNIVQQTSFNHLYYSISAFFKAQITSMPGWQIPKINGV